MTANLNNEITTRTALGTSVTTEISRATAAESSLAVVLASVNSTLGGSAAATACGSGTSVAMQQEYWMDNSVADNETISMTFVPAYVKGVVLKILGVGFGAYYNPQFQVSFSCNFYNPAFGNITTFGVVIYDPVASFLFYHVECPVPAMPVAGPVTISLYKSTGQLFPFGGFAGANILNVQYFWSSISTVGTNSLMVTGQGFSTAKSYRCVFTGKNTTNGTVTVSFISPVASNLTTLSCGLTPAGFAVVSGTSTVNLTIFEANVDNSSGYQIQPTGSIFATFSTCFDGAIDGDETDVDCGGSTCATRCSHGKACIVTSDCIGSCIDNVCVLTTTTTKTTTTKTTSTSTTTTKTTTTPISCNIRVLVNGYDSPAAPVSLIQSTLAAKYPGFTMTITQRTNGVFSDLTKANFDVLFFWSNGNFASTLSPYCNTFSAAGGGMVHGQFSQSTGTTGYGASTSIFSVYPVNGGQAGGTLTMQSGSVHPIAVGKFPATTTVPVFTQTGSYSATSPGLTPGSSVAIAATNGNSFVTVKDTGTYRTAYLNSYPISETSAAFGLQMTNAILWVSNEYFCFCLGNIVIYIKRKYHIRVLVVIVVLLYAT